MIQVRMRVHIQYNAIDYTIKDINTGEKYYENIANIEDVIGDYTVVELMINWCKLYRGAFVIGETEGNPLIFDFETQRVSVVTPYELSINKDIINITELCFEGREENRIKATVFGNYIDDKNMAHISSHSTSSVFIVPPGITRIAEMHIGKADKVVFPSGVVCVGALCDAEDIGGNNTFCDGNRINTIKFSDTVQVILHEAFMNVNIKNLEFGNSLRVIGDSAFFNSEVENMTLPDSVRLIGMTAFGYSKIKKLTIPNSVIGIEKYAFNHNRELKELKLPDTMKYVSRSMFANSNIREISVRSNESNIAEDVNGIYLGNALFTECAVEHLELPEGIKIIEKEAFCNCHLLERVSIPHSVNMICKHAFLGAFGLREIDLPNSLEVIETEAFYNAGEIDTLVIPRSIKFIGENAFYGTKIKELWIPSNFKIMHDIGITPATKVKTYQ